MRLNAQRVEEERVSSNDLLKDHEEHLQAAEAKVVKLEEDLKIFNERTTGNITLEEIIKNYLISEEFQDELTDCEADSFF